MPKITRDDVAKLENLSDAVKADLTALFTDIEEKEKTLATLTKEKADADEVVKRAPAVEKENTELKAKKAELEGLLAKYTGKPKNEISLLAFWPFFSSED